jgi:hypothetical protein
MKEQGTSLEEKSGSQSQNSIEELRHEIELLTQEVHKRNSRSRLFWDGVVLGLGRTIGATIFFAILITFMSYLVQTTNIEWLNTLIEWFGLHTYLN